LPSFEDGFFPRCLASRQSRLGLAFISRLRATWRHGAAVRYALPATLKSSAYHAFASSSQRIAATARAASFRAAGARIAQNAAYRNGAARHVRRRINQASAVAA